MTTKELLAATGISQPTLRRWLREAHRIPELQTAKRDWRGWRTWEPRHVQAILTYQNRRIAEVAR